MVCVRSCGICVGETPLNSSGLRWRAIAAALLLSCGVVATADSEPLLERAEVQNYLRDIARQHGLNQHRLADLFVDLTRNEKVLELIRRPAERRLTWPEYRAIFLGDERIAAGQAYLAEHARLFDAVESRYGVPRAIIAAIIGVETFYGRFTGGFRVLDALATLAFEHPPRSAFFTAELTEFLRLGTREGWDLATVQGSYAGAMGLPQFIASSYRRYAVDGDGDEVVDLFASQADVIASVANYLAEHAWQPGARVAEPVPVADVDVASWARDGLKPSVAAAALIEAGVRSPALEEAAAAGQKVSVMIFAADNGEDALIGYNNFYAITRYNHSRLYARAVLTLAQALDPGFR